MTSRQLANMVIEENEPFDYKWLKSILRAEGYKGILRIAKSTTECFADNTMSKQLIGRAAGLVAEEIMFHI